MARNGIRMSTVDVDINYYEVLGVARDASQDVICESYRRLMQHGGHHPDRGGDARTAALINKAYAILKDPVQRKDYDMRLDILAKVTMGLDIEAPVEASDPTKQCLFCGRPHNYGINVSRDDGCDNCGSPLRGVDNYRPANGDLRTIWRLDRELETVFFTHWQQVKGCMAKTVDISPRGVRIVTPYDLRPGQRIRLANNLLQAVGKITHCATRRGRWRVENVAGISFLTLRILRPVGGFVSSCV